MKCKNYALAKRQEEEIDEEKAAKMACLEHIGLELYKTYGQDCFAYSLCGAPVNIDFIEKEIKEVKTVTNIDLPVCAVYRWAQILDEHWEKYPNGIMTIEELKNIVEELPSTGIKIYVNNNTAKDWKDIILRNINDCSWANPQSLLNDIGIRLKEQYGIIIAKPIIVKGKEYQIEY